MGLFRVDHFELPILSTNFVPGSATAAIMGAAGVAAPVTFLPYPFIND